MEKRSKKINGEIKKGGNKHLRTKGKIDGAVWQMITIVNNLNSTYNSQTIY